MDKGKHDDSKLLKLQYSLHSKHFHSLHIHYPVYPGKLVLFIDDGEYGKTFCSIFFSASQSFLTPQSILTT